MRCPKCGENTPDSLWVGFSTDRMKMHEWDVAAYGNDDATIATPDGTHVHVDWMKCAKEDCGEIVIRITEATRRFVGGAPIGVASDSWFARPQFADFVQREVHDLVLSRLGRTT